MGSPMAIRACRDVPEDSIFIMFCSLFYFIVVYILHFLPSSFLHYIKLDLLYICFVFHVFIYFSLISVYVTRVRLSLVC